MKFKRILSGIKRRATDVLAGTPAGFSRPDNRPFEPAEIAGLTVACHTDWQLGQTLLRDWDSLSLTHPAGTPFHCPGWLEAAHAICGNGRPLRILSVYRKERLLAVVPLELTGDGGLSSPGAPVSDYCDPLVRPEGQEETWRAVFEYAASNWDRKLEEIAFYNVRENAALRAILPTLEGFAYEEKFQENAPYVTLPEKWDDFIEHLEAHERRETRRKLMKAETKAGAKLNTYTGADIPAALERGIAILESCGGEKGAAVTRILRPLLLKAAPALIEQGRLLLKLLTVEGVQAACLFEFVGPTGPSLYNTGFDMAKKEWSPGTVAVAMTLRDCVQRGIRGYDFLRGQEPYKYRLGAVDRALYRVTLKKR